MSSREALIYFVAWIVMVACIGGATFAVVSYETVHTERVAAVR